MSKENVEVVRRFLTELANRFPIDGVDDNLTDAFLAKHFDPEIEWNPAEQALLVIDSYEGYEGMRQFWRELLSSWEEFALEAQELFDVGSHVAAMFLVSGRAQGRVVAENWSALLSVHEERIVRVQIFRSRDGAREAAGLSE